MPYEHRAPANRHFYFTYNSNILCAVKAVGDCAQNCVLTMSVALKMPGEILEYGICRARRTCVEEETAN